MKRIASIILVLMGTCFGLSAQSTLDRPAGYLYQRDDDTLMESGYFLFDDRPVRYFYGKEFVVAEPVRLTGIAATLSCLELADTGTSADMYAILITKNGNSFVRVDSVKRPYRYTPDYYYLYNLSGVTCDGDPQKCPVPLYEFYFKTPHMVYDTFYLGIKSFHRSNGANYQEGASYPRVAAVPIYTYNGNNPGDPCPMESWWLMQDGTRPAGSQYIRQSLYYQNAIFGILTTPDTDALPECPEVEGFRVQRYYNHMPVFAWDGDTVNGLYEIAYGPRGTGVNDCQLVSCHEGPYLLQDNALDSNISYWAFIRRQCYHECVVHDTNYWSPWSHQVLFHTGVHDPSPDTNSQGIVSPHQQAFTLSPNPAQDFVALTCQYGIKRGEAVLRDALGKELRRVNVEQGTARIPLSDIPAGVYLVTLTTDQGTSTQRLVVE